MDCASIKPLLERFLDEDLSGSERVKVEAHLAACDACRRTLGALHSVDDAVRGDFVPDPGEAYWGQLSKDVTRRIETQTGAVKRPHFLQKLWDGLQPGPVRIGLAGLVVAALAVMIVRISIDDGKIEEPAALFFTESADKGQAASEAEDTVPALQSQKEAPSLAGEKHAETPAQAIERVVGESSAEPPQADSDEFRVERRLAKSAPLFAPMKTMAVDAASSGGGRGREPDPAQLPPQVLDARIHELEVMMDKSAVEDVDVLQALMTVYVIRAERTQDREHIQAAVDFYQDHETHFVSDADLKQRIDILISLLSE